MSDKLLPRGLYGLIDDAGLAPDQVVERAQAVLRGGAGVVQLRLKHTADRLALPIIQEVRSLAATSEARVIVNDRIDLALVGGAHGVHLGDDDLPPQLARALLGAHSLIGVTARSAAGAEHAAAAGADYVGLGPVFRSSTKSVAHSLLGLEGLRAVTQRSPLPVVAISGITLATIGAVARAGAHAAAVSADIFAGGSPVSRAEALHRAFLEHA